MALPPLELFSLKKRLPCCRVASSLFRIQLLGDGERENSPKWEASEKKIVIEREAGFSAADAERYEERYEVLRRKRHTMSHALHTALQMMIALLFLVILILPNDFANDADLDADDRNRNHIP